MAVVGKADRPGHSAAAAWLASFPWVLFLAFSAVGFFVMPFGIGEYEVRAWLGEGVLAGAAVWFLGVSDAIWIILAAVNVYIELARREGLAVARRWSIIILAGSGLLEAVGAMTGIPFGPYTYTDHFGVRIFGILPFTIPLAWFIVVISGRALVLWLVPGASRLVRAAGVGLIAVLTDLNLEFVAWKVRAYWIWYPGDPAPPAWPPPQNFAAWFVASVLFAALLPGGHSRHGRPAIRSVVVLGLMNALFFAVHIGGWIQG